MRIAGHDKSKLPPYWTAGRVWTLMGIVVASLVVSGVAMLLVMRRIERERYTATLRERLRLSHDLHDNLQQLLAATMFRLDAAQSFFDFDLKSAREQLGWAKKAVESTQAGLRSVLWDLHEESEGPESLTGLVRYAVGRMAHWSGKVAVEVVGSEPDGVRRHGGHFLMIIQEAVGNALSRGGATNVRVRLFFRPGLVRLVVTDNGCRILGHQDTLFADSQHHGDDFSRQYYENCCIEGTVDFIYGCATAVFNACKLNFASCGYLTAGQSDGCAGRSHSRLRAK